MEKELKKLLTEEMKKTGYIYNGDNSDREIDIIARNIIIANSSAEELEDNLNDYLDDLIVAGNIYLESNYKKVGECDIHGFYKGYFYDKKYNFNSVEELENFFGIVE
ncbi:hypothetical protein [uncultured Fusobacterium sp.]|uniref:hypothetical protein n=1 Tax=uncultured Fusobacterium sp. TaxID=159267 RepID=UPI0025EBC77F|nr:hypothetical protein [uncultured Fusobacterium sp.]